MNILNDSITSCSDDETVVKKRPRRECAAYSGKVWTVPDSPDIGTRGSSSDIDVIELEDVYESGDILTFDFETVEILAKYVELQPTIRLVREELSSSEVVIDE